MSVKLSAYVWDGCAAAGMKITSVAIMARLADFSSDEGVCWPSIATIARQIGAGASTVRTAIATLEQEGWLTRTERRNGNRNASNLYQLNVKKMREAAMFHLTESDASKSDTSNSDTSKSGASVSDASISGAPESSMKCGFHPPESGDDPSLNSKHDPSVKTLSQVSAKPDSRIDSNRLAINVLEHLNRAAGTRYQKASSSLGPIRGRLAEDFTADDLILTVDYMVAKWGSDAQMSDYLRPSTLFRQSKFPGYLKSAGNWEKAGRPPCVGGQWKRDVMHVPSADYPIPDGFRG
ncbi:conserved phage C-terminal domain-containing protein [Pantoea sp. NPDC088449]|uniref:conserved phage C-terminal domain-containing protein n=1 Tax=Pantoea sp. NPDC088449 TaxID=3364392 RepID=UPI00382EBA08